MNAMKVLDVNDSSLGSDVLANAVKLKITYYDSAYLTLAEKFKAVLVTDDKKLEKASIKAGIKPQHRKARRSCMGIKCVIQQRLSCSVELSCGGEAYGS